MSTMTRRAQASALAAITTVLFTSYAAGASDVTTDRTASGGGDTLTLWTHSAGNPAEMEALEGWIEAFNSSHDVQVVEEAFPQGAYNETVVAAALSDSMPCILDIDGPNTPNWAWSGYLHPLELPAELLDPLAETLKGVYDDQLYSVGQFDAAVAMLARQSDLDELGLRVPTIEEPWTAEEFQAVLDAYNDSGNFEYAFDPGLAWTGEWYPYAFSPFLQSFGGDLIDRETMLSAEGVLNGPEAVAFGEWLQTLVTDGYMPGPSQSPADRDAGFIDGRYGLQWNGIWAANAAIEALGDDVVFLPAPDFGNGPTIGAGSWQWAVSASCENPEGAQEWIEFLLDPARIAEIADAQNVIPGSEAARVLTTKFADGAPLAVFYDLAAAQALIRPPTPAYPNIALSFEQALNDIVDGVDVQTALDSAVDEIDADIEANDGYGF
jgi:multiple sugar transport system substrate-binding protein